ncbi:MAG: transcriptional regulator, partial [Planctomycetaceae bacterium]
SGSPEIVNGLSCMACHKAGMRQFEDVVGPAVAVGNEDQADKVRGLFKPAALERQLERDTEEFVRLLNRVIAPVLLAGDDAGQDIINDFPEPIAAVARQYDKDLGIEEVAAELGVDVAFLRANLPNARLRALGLGTLRQPDGRIKRDMWQARDEIASPFQEAARELDLGIGVSRGAALNDDDC